MRLLLDTHALLWWVEDDPQLSPKVRRQIADERNYCLVSLASAWEMAIKAGLGKLKLAVSVQHYFQEHLAPNNFQLLPIGLEHVTLVETLPLLTAGRYGTWEQAMGGSKQRCPSII